MTCDLWPGGMEDARGRADVGRAGGCSGAENWKTDAEEGNPTILLVILVILLIIAYTNSYYIRRISQLAKLGNDYVHLTSFKSI